MLPPCRAPLSAENAPHDRTGLGHIIAVDPVAPLPVSTEEHGTEGVAKDLLGDMKKGPVEVGSLKRPSNAGESIAPVYWSAQNPRRYRTLLVSNVLMDVGGQNAFLR